MTENEAIRLCFAIQNYLGPSDYAVPKQNGDGSYSAIVHGIYKFDYPWEFILFVLARIPNKYPFE